MINTTVEEQIVKLLAEGKLSQRTIAREVGVSRGTAHAIATGVRPGSLSRAQKRRIENAPPFSGPYVRCLGCGHKVKMPCFECETEKKRQVGKAIRERVTE